MGRTARPRRPPNVKPVERVELSEKHVKLRFLAVALLLLVGVSAIGYAVSSFFRREPGWREIKVDSASTETCGGDFVFLYRLGESDVSPTAENKALTLAYTKLCEEAYRLFDAGQEFSQVHNLCYLNHHPNEKVQVDAALYDAFSLLADYGSRLMYLAPVYAAYDDLFVCGDDALTAPFDPYVSEETAAQYAELAAIARDDGAVDLKLLDGGYVELFVSDEYLKYAEENGITAFIDFFWMKNAFTADYLAQKLQEQGYTRGTLSSFDGFVRCLDTGGEYSFNIYDRVGDAVYPAAVMNYAGPLSLVSLRDYKLNSLDERFYYEYADGSTRTSYLDIRDGRCRSAEDSLVCYSHQTGCAEVLLEMVPLYIADTWEEETARALAARGIYSVYGRDFVLYYNEESLSLSGLYDGEDASYTKVYR